MRIDRAGIKLFLDKASQVEPPDLIPVFHSWIQQQSIQDHLLIDVHNYSHIFRGPGVLLVAHEGNFSLDLADGRPGLLYYRKQPVNGSPQGPLKSALSGALQAALRLQREERLAGRLRFRSDELLFIANDRLAAPNTVETFEELRPLLSEFFEGLFNPCSIELSHAPDPRERLSVQIRVSGPSSLENLQERLR